MSLEQSLSELGIRPSTDVTLPATLVDIVEELVFDQYPFIANHQLHPLPQSILSLVDTHADLFMLMQRIEATLSRHGHQVVRSVERAKVEVAGTALGGQVSYKTQCNHPLVDVDESAEHLICRGCGTAVNPMWWIAKFTKECMRAAQARNGLLTENAKLRTENESLRKERNANKSAVNRKKRAATKKS